ncbi:hypothetical protein Cni_G28797 [Canna indica]|uniref:Uncharacterized protein n=1 Tax=Canna indica TaxID=4628 RepID=A0AAQ3QTF3_9LILI|nr:hypothetical protein Cni_G28797 [Canna indica]
MNDDEHKSRCHPNQIQQCMPCKHCGQVESPSLPPSIYSITFTTPLLIAEAKYHITSFFLALSCSEPSFAAFTHKAGVHLDPEEVEPKGEGKTANSSVMACINMLSSDRQALCSVPAVPPMSPRISFSSDFAVEPPAARAPAPPPDPNFEFAVGGDAMIDADQLFFKGRMLPLKESHGHYGPQRITTLREELLSGDEDGGQWERPMRGSIKWKELLGLKKSHCGLATVPVPLPAKKSDKSEELLKPAQEL